MQAQSDSLSFHTDLYFLAATQDFQPHWQVSNRYGIFDKDDKAEVVGLAGVAYQFDFGKRWKAESELEINLKSDISSSYLQQAYFNLYYGKLQLKIGKEAYTIGQYSDDLSSGSLFVSNNARPMPRIGIGFYDYTRAPFIGKYVEFKGAMNFGILDDDRSEYNGTDHPLYHEKFFYLRSTTLPVNVHLGINHSAQFGGTQYNGTKIETDFMATFFGKSSGKIGGGESTNVAGAHFGIYDIGLNWKINDHGFTMYFQKPFSDGSGMKLGSKDKSVGLLIESNEKGLISSILYEYINTIHQSGNGTPDPILDEELIFTDQIDDLDKFMLENFDTVTVGITKEAFSTFLMDELNYGNRFGGRDDHYNNYLYPRGQSYHKNAIGSSLFLSQDDMKVINDDFDGQYDRYFVSNRVEAHHLAFEGYLGKHFSYRAKLTYTKNRGSYAGANQGRYNWASIENPEYYNSYYFKEVLKQGYTFLEVNYTIPKWKGMSISSSIAYDFGEMYHNFGILFGFHYDGMFSLGKKK